MNVTGNNAPSEEVDMDSVYRKYSLSLKKYVFGMCRNETLADDIVSETFYRAIKNIDSFRGGNIFTWLCEIAKNTYFNHLKKKENQNVSLDAAECIEPVSPKQVEDEVMTKAQNLELYRNLQKLDGTERDVVYMRMFADLSFKEIGEVLGKSENWARVTYFRSREKLKKNYFG